MVSTNIKMLQSVAHGFGELKNEMVFVGGSVAELYADNPGASDIRPTLDVDCVIELGSKREHDKLEGELRAIGFAHDISSGAPICRWIFKDIKVDVMPADMSILGFSNRWYVPGIENRIVKTLPDGTEIFVFSVEYYLASKFEAHKDRGGDDLRQSHDFEDIIYIIDNCPDLLENISKAKVVVKNYLSHESQGLLNDPNITEGIECALPYGAGGESTDLAQFIIESIAGIND
jgi:predicted nucleotidyltransferase